MTNAGVSVGIRAVLPPERPLISNKAAQYVVITFGAIGHR